MRDGGDRGAPDAAPARLAIHAEGSTAPAGMAVTVTRVIDGDTVHVTDARGSRIKVRVLGIDTPETQDPRVPVQCWGPEATRFATATLLHQRVRLVGDRSQDVRGRFGRVLAYLYLSDGSNYSVLAAGAGAARSYVYNRCPVAEHAAIAAAEADARAARRGLWGASHLTPCSPGALRFPRRAGIAAATRPQRHCAAGLGRR